MIAPLLDKEFHLESHKCKMLLSMKYEHEIADSLIEMVKAMIVLQIVPTWSSKNESCLIF